MIRRARKTLILLSSFPAIIAAWALLTFGIPTYRDLAPSYWWMQVHSVHIDSAFVGNDPSMVVDRDLNLTEPTRGIWTATLRDRSGSVVCTNTGASDYKPGANLPKRDRLKLFAWWMFVPADRTPASICDKWPLPPGKYCLTTLWQFSPPGYPTKDVTHPPACFLYVERN